MGRWWLTGAATLLHFLLRKKIATRDISAILVDLKVDGAPSMFTLVAADGSINRMGTGAVNNSERELYIGITDPKLFEAIRSAITGDLLKWVGREWVRSRGASTPTEKVCELLVAFRLTNGKDSGFRFRYGSESLGPPSEVSQFVATVVQATAPWYEAFKSTTACRTAK